MTYWVIREGLVRGEGRYWTIGRVKYEPSMRWTEHLHMATRYEKRAAKFLVGLGQNCRLVRVTRKPRGETVTMEHHLAAMKTRDEAAYQEGHWEGAREAREAALEEASRFLEVWEHDDYDCRTAAEAVAALRTK